MDHSDVVAQFCGITDAPAHVAENYLEAMEWQLERAIDFFMEHPPNHEADRFDSSPYPAPGFQPVRSEAIEIPDDDDAGGLAELAQHRARGLAARRATEEQEEGALLAEGLAVQGIGLEPAAGPGPSSTAAASGGGHHRHGAPVLPLLGEASLMDVEHNDGEVLPAEMPAQDGPGLQVSAGGGLSAPDELYSSFHRRQQESLLAHYQQQARQQQAAAYQQLGMAEGLDPEDREAAQAAAAAAAADADEVTAVGRSGIDLPLNLPEEINLEEARMLEAAMLGIPYAGRMPDFSGAQDAAAAAAPLSPGTIEQRTLRQEQDDAYEESLALDRAKQASIAAAEEEAREAALKEQKDAAAAAQAEAEAQQQLAALLATKQQRLMGEPAASEPGVLKIVVRMPDGSRKGRRFKATDPLQALFDYVDVECADPSGNGDASATTAAAEPRCGFKLGQYRLVTQFPRKVFVEGSTQSLQEAGIASDTALFVEPLT